MRKIKVLFYARKQEPPQWQEGIIEAFSGKHDLRIFNIDSPMTEQFRDAEVVIDQGGWGTREMIDAAADTKLWQILGTGLDHIDVNYINSKGIKAANCPGEFSRTGLAECAMMFILMLTRQWNKCGENLRQGILYKPFGKSLQDTTLAILGFGSSGKELAIRAKSFGMRIEAIDIIRPDNRTLEQLKLDFFGSPDEMDEVIKRCDFLSLHLHLNSQTRHIIDDRRIKMMKPTACIINVSRGDLIDEQAMHDALLNGKLGGAGVDVFAEEPVNFNLPVYKLPNVFASPHIAGTTDETVRGRVSVALENTNRLAEGREIMYQVSR